MTLNPAIDKTVVVEQFEEGGLNRVRPDIKNDPGGKGINVAKVLQRFNVDVLATGLIAGQQGKKLLASLNQMQIKTDFTEIAGETRTNLKIVDLAKKQTTEVNEPGFTVGEKSLADFTNKLAAHLTDVSYLVLGGSFPQGVPSTIYHDFIKKAEIHGVKTILDAEGEAFREGLKAQPYAVKPNAYELEVYFGRKLATIEDLVIAGRQLIEMGVKLVIISMGKDGAIIMDEMEIFQAATLPIKPDSTVGAGDSMVGVLVYCLLHNMSLKEIAKWTSAAGGITASKQGTEVCTFDEVKMAAEKIEVIQI